MQYMEQVEALLRVRDSFDILCRKVEIGGRRARLYVVDGLCKDEILQKLLQFWMGITPEDMQAVDGLARFSEKYLAYTETEVCAAPPDMAKNLLSGAALLFLEPYREALVVDARTYPVRSVGEPDDERVLRGAHDGFVETLIFNVALLRRRIRDTRLTIEALSVGRRSKTDVAIAYLAGKADAKFVKNLRARIARLDVNALTMAAQTAGIAYDKVVLFPASHAAYYPGAQSMAMKVLYEKESLRLLGAQIVGGEGVDKRIDVLATAIRAKMTALELTELDLSYAPPYSSAKDPVNMAGFMIEDLESGKVQQFHWNDVEDLPCDGSATLLDVRTEGEYRRGHLNGFRNIPLDDLREHLDELDRGKPVYVNCQTGLRSYLACRLLTQYGFTCAHLSGGYSFYQVVTQEQQTAQSAYPCGMEKL